MNSGLLIITCMYRFSNLKFGILQAMWCIETTVFINQFFVQAERINHFINRNQCIYNMHNYITTFDFSASIKPPSTAFEKIRHLVHAKRCEVVFAILIVWRQLHEVIPNCMYMIWISTVQLNSTVANSVLDFCQTYCKNIVKEKKEKRG